MVVPIIILMAASICIYLVLYNLVVFFMGSDKRASLAFTFLFASSTIFIFGQGMLMLFQNSDIHLMQVWSKISYSGATLIILAIPLAVKSFLNYKMHYWLLISGGILTIGFIVATNLSGWFVDISPAVLVSKTGVLSLNIGYVIYRIAIIGVVIYIMLEVLIRELSRAPHKQQVIRILTIGILSLALSSIISLAVDLFKGPQYVQPFIFTAGLFILTICSIIAILRHNIDLLSCLHNNEKHVKKLLYKSQKDLIDFTQLIATTLDARDQYTLGHSQRVMSYSLQLAEALELSHDDKDILRTATLLHDIGKIGIPDQILNKPGRLTPEEYEIIKKHPSIAVDILSNVSQFIRVIPFIAHHHERIDGKGYPNGLTGKDLPKLTKIISIADTFDAITSHRPYRQALDNTRALAILSEVRGSQLDGDLVDTFITSMNNMMQTIH